MGKVREKRMNTHTSLESLLGALPTENAYQKKKNGGETHLEQKKSTPFRLMKKDRPDKYNQ